LQLTTDYDVRVTEDRHDHDRWFTNEDCSVARTLEIVGERWSLLLLREAFYGVRRFEEFQRNLGVARNILTDRLQRLVAHGIFERRQYQERPVRFEYRLTQRGIDLYPALISLLAWGDRYLADRPSGGPVVLEHKGCGKASVPYLACSACGEAITARDMRPRPRRRPAKSAASRGASRTRRATAGSSRPARAE
jgi:DNA-binding HxlR family transcriptional regulator